jgi:hypothetical protein
MRIKYTKKKSRLAPLVLSVGLISTAVVFMSMDYCPPCSESLCVIILSDGAKVYPKPSCPPCVSGWTYLFQKVFGHHEKHSDNVARSTAPCE